MLCGKLEYIQVSTINLDNYFGFLEVDIEVPEHSYNYFSEFPPIVRTLNIQMKFVEIIQLIW